MPSSHRSSRPSSRNSPASGRAERYKAIAEYYDFEYAARDMLRHDVPFFLEQVGKLSKAGKGGKGGGRRSRVLELAVGTGRAAIPIAQAGHRVVGVDYDEALLAIARRKRDSVGLREKDLDLRPGDIRCLASLDLGPPFDWACLFFNTFLAFPTLAEQDQLLQGVRRHLSPGGRFWIDIFQPTQAVLPEGTQKDLSPTAFYVPALGRTVFKSITIRHDALRQVQHVTFNYRWFDAQGRPRHERTDFEMTALWPRELQILMERNGLAIEKMWGNYDGSALADHSPRLIACCKRV